jgi:hypothetical protein
MKRKKTINRLPVVNQTQAKSQSTIAGFQSQTSGSHGNQAVNRSPTGFLPLLIALCSLLIYPACEQPSSDMAAGGGLAGERPLGSAAVDMTGLLKLGTRRS